MYITVGEKTYECATTLRVAYIVQGQHNHKPYTQIFEDIGEMTVEDQIGIVYAAIKAANKGIEKEISFNTFMNDYLDACTLTDLLDQVKEIINGIMGKDMSAEAGVAESEGSISTSNF